MIYDLTQYQCPQLFVQFKYNLKMHQESESVKFQFSESAQLNDVFRYLENHHIQYLFHANHLTVYHFGKESI